MQCLTYTVPPAFDGDTLQNFLRRDCGLSWRMVVRLKQVEGGMAVDGVPRRTIDRVCAGQTVTLRLPEDTVRIEGADIPLTVVFEDDALLVVDKPPYLAVHPSAGKPEPTLANAVVAHYARQGTPLSFRPTNRLDRNTSGLLLAAKNPHVAYALTGKAYKEYLAVVLGELHGSGTVDAPIRVRDELAALRSAAEAGELDAGALGPVPLDGTALESVRMEDGAAVLSLRGEKAAAWLSSEPLDRLGVYSVPWRGSARPGVLYTEYLGSGWYAGYACLGWG